jgi:transposase
MPFLVTKKDKYGNEYLYIRHNHRVDGKSKMAYQVYLGPKKDFDTRARISRMEFETETIEFGLIAALLHVAKKIGLVDAINRATAKRNQGLDVGEHFLIAAINRCVEPLSKSRMEDWLDSTILQKVYPDIGVKLDASAYWTHFQYMTEDNMELVENELIQVIKEKYDVDYSHLSFDPTNFYTYINPKKPNQELAKHGHPKDGKATLNLINLSLFLTIDGGIPLFHLAYPGNTVDPVHFKTALKSLEKRFDGMDEDLKSVTLTFDKGNLSVDGFKVVDEMGIYYICSDRPSTHKDLLAIPPDEFAMHVLPNGKEVGVKEYHLEKYGKTRRFIAVYNPNEARWNQENLDKKVNKRVEEIKTYFVKRARFKPGERKKGRADKWRKRVEVEDKLKTMVGNEPYKSIIITKVDGPDEIPVDKGGTLKVSVSINSKAKDVASLKLGKSFLMTNRDDLEGHDVVWIYRQQYLVELAFKWLKNRDFLSIRPMWHHVDSSIRGHVFTCYLGLVLLSLLIREVTQLGIPTSIDQLIKNLKEIKLTRIHVSGRPDPIENIDKMSPEAKLLHEKLALNKYL